MYFGKIIVVLTLEAMCNYAAIVRKSVMDVLMHPSFEVNSLPLTNLQNAAGEYACHKAREEAADKAAREAAIVETVVGGKEELVKIMEEDVQQADDLLCKLQQENDCEEDFERISAGARKLMQMLCEGIANARKLCGEERDNDKAEECLRRQHLKVLMHRKYKLKTMLTSALSSLEDMKRMAAKSSVLAAATALSLKPNKDCT